MEPLGQALRYIGRDIDRMEGSQPAFADLGERAEPLFLATFQGSFGIRLGAPPVAEQLTLDGSSESLFERAANRLVLIFKASRSDDPRSEIVEQIVGLRPFAISGLKKLTTELEESGITSSIRWRQDTPIRVSVAEASVIREVLETSEQEESSIEIDATLIGGDVNSGWFHLVGTDEDGKPKDYRGKASEQAASQLELRLRSRVRAVLSVMETRSQYLAQPKPVYVLETIEPI
jgi:hypothetical protein